MTSETSSPDTGKPERAPYEPPALRRLDVEESGTASDHCLIDHLLWVLAVL
jgi:hypothetical protein